MELFVNRDTELQLIDDSFESLLDRKRLLRTPIIEFQGVGGIGKTSLLKQVQQRCHATQLPYIWVDVSRNPSGVAHEIITQVQKYTLEDEISLEQSPVYATKVLLKQGPVVMLFDSIDTADDEQLTMVDSLLHDLIDYEKLFVVLTSSRDLPLGQERSVARKLTTRLLKPIDRESCEFYFNNQGNQIEPAIRDIIFEWTRGYPVAMNIMTQAIGNGLDPRSDEGSLAILALLKKQVIDYEVLGSVRPGDQERYRTELEIFSVPRRFNLFILQDLIEQFYPALKRESSVAYISMQKEINDATNILNWSMLRAGFIVDEPIRNIFLLLLRNEQPERYFAIHAFLAQANLNLAKEVTGSDRARYIRECLYHIASNISSPQLTEQLAQPLDIILKESPETFLQFREEFSQDKELKETLGDHLANIQAIIDNHFNAQ